MMSDAPADTDTVRALDWIVRFYGWRGTRQGPTGIFDRHRARAARLVQHCGSERMRILDLGAGAGGTAAALADLGHDVTAIEIDPVRACFARDLAKEPRAGTLTVVEADYFLVDLEGRFDAVGHWDSFGMGSDAHQRRLLRRIADDWLTPYGKVILDIFNPLWWAARHGQITHQDWCGMTERQEFDPLSMCFVDTWWEDGDEAGARAQTVRCYSPADFRLLLEGTGLELKALEVEDVPLFDADGAPSLAAWQDAVMSYQVVLTHVASC